MRDQFSGYFPPTKSEIDTLFSSALIVLDTNALLNLYRYKVDVRNTFLAMLTQLKDRLWLPHRVGFEFHRRRVDVIREQYSVVEKISKRLGSAADSLEKDLLEFRRNAIVEVESVIAAVSKVLVEQKQLVDGLGRSSSKAYGITPLQDDTLSTLAKLYEGKIGSALSGGELDEVRKEGEVRYELKLPPGFRDAGKDGDEKYGDLVLWKQIIAHAKTVKASILFLTDDNKEDWWWKSNGETLGPRPELREEFHRETGAEFYCYRPHYFLQLLKKRGEFTVSSDVVREVEETGQLSNSRELLHELRSVDRRELRNSDLDLIDSKGLRSEIATVNDRIRLLNRRIDSLEESGLAREVLHKVAQLEHVAQDTTAEVEYLSMKLRSLPPDDQRDQIVEQLDAARTRQIQVQARLVELRASVSEEQRYNVMRLRRERDRLRKLREVLGRRLMEVDPVAIPSEVDGVDSPD